MDEPNEILAAVQALAEQHLNRIIQATEMDEGEWERTFDPIDNPRHDCCMAFDPHEEEDLAFLRTVDPRQIWTEIDHEDRYAILPGVHRVNRISYFVTRVPWRDDQADLIVLSPPLEEDDEWEDEDDEDEDDDEE